MKKLGLFLMVVFVVIGQSSWSQCAMCKSTAEAGQENEIEFGRNINIGILLLMIVPYIILFLLFRKQIFRLYKSLVKK
jgi:ABC-type glycerol-3-phosphate transport system permease component